MGCDLRELDRLNELAALTEKDRKASADLAGYLTAIREWTRRGKPGTLPSPMPYGLMISDVTCDLGAIDIEFRDSHGLSNWNFYNPDYYGPMMEIRQIAVDLGVDPDAAAQEFTAAGERLTPTQWSPALTPERSAILAAYRNRIYHVRQKAGRPPYSQAGASSLLQEGGSLCCFVTSVA